MAQKNLTYSVRGIFTDCLTGNHAHHFLIDAYQRGYKWDSSNLDEDRVPQNGESPREVDKLLTDLWRQFKAQPQFGLPPEYYLQFLTLKAGVSSGGHPILEVIDGQQRLTTLSVLFAVLRHLAADPTDQANFAFAEFDAVQSPTTVGKLEYGVRAHFLDHFVYQGNVRYLLEASTWEEFKNSTFPHSSQLDLDQQDIYYLYKAARRMKLFLQAPSRVSQLITFGQYVADYARLIANVVEEEISSEEIFSNLNSNRKPLTDTELVKGLLLTRASRQGPPRTFQEIQELRTVQGRQWDEMASWVNQESVRVLYKFKPKTAFWEVLRLVALRLTAADPAQHKLVTAFTPQENKFPLFDLFEQLIQLCTQASSALACFGELRMVTALLKDWHSTPQVHNLIGVLGASQTYTKQRELLPTLLSDHSLEGGVSNYLRREIGELACLEKAPQELSYVENKQETFDFLLLLNVFPAFQEKTHPFRFVRFSKEKWSLEHIFPQNPELPQDADGYDRQLLRAFNAPEEVLTAAKSELLAVTAPNEEQLVQLEAWQQADTALRHSLGNLALLATKDNSSFSNLPFAQKRQRLISRVQTGSFVPTHTFSVFSKLVLADRGHIDQWTRADILSHATYLVQEHARLRKDFCDSVIPTPAL